jgi:hypothetical protein
MSSAMLHLSFFHIPGCDLLSTLPAFAPWPPLKPLHKTSAPPLSFAWQQRAASSPHLSVGQNLDLLFDMLPCAGVSSLGSGLRECRGKKKKKGKE